MDSRQVDWWRVLGMLILAAVGIAELVGFAAGIHALQAHGWLGSEGAPCPRVHSVP